MGCLCPASVVARRFSNQDFASDNICGTKNPWPKCQRQNLDSGMEPMGELLDALAVNDEASESKASRQFNQPASGDRAPHREYDGGNENAGIACARSVRPWATRKPKLTCSASVPVFTMAKTSGKAVAFCPLRPHRKMVDESRQQKSPTRSGICRTRKSLQG